MKSINKCPHRLSVRLLKNKKQRREVYLLSRTTSRRCVGRIIGILKPFATPFYKKIKFFILRYFFKRYARNL